MTAPLRIGVDARAFASPAGGVRRYAWEIYRRLPRLEPGVEVIAIGATPDAPLPDGLERRPARAFPTNLGWTAASLPLAVRGARLDVFHAPAYTAPLWGVHPQAVTIHDVSYERVPEWNAYKNDAARRWFYRRSALAADCVITDSEFSRNEIAAAYGITLRKIRVVPLAAADFFTPGPFDSRLAPPGVRQPYVLHVGDLQIRRNLATALDAVLRLRTRPLFVCAGMDRGIGASLVTRARAAGDPDALVLTGPVSEEALLNLYRGAALLAYPSRYEGFGLPILEAMRCGIPVVGARAASIPEVIGDAGTLVDPVDVDAWHSAIADILAGGETASRLRQASLVRASQFSWDRTASETLAALRDCAAEGRRR